VQSLQTTDDRQQTTDDGRQVMAIVHLDLWSRWTKNITYYCFSFQSDIQCGCQGQ
jgi:hypothetical protein